jgi:hypothetical protein
MRSTKVGINEVRHAGILLAPSPSQMLALTQLVLRFRTARMPFSLNWSDLQEASLQSDIVHVGPTV